MGETNAVLFSTSENDPFVVSPSKTKVLAHESQGVSRNGNDSGAVRQHPFFKAYYVGFKEGTRVWMCLINTEHNMFPL